MINHTVKCDICLSENFKPYIKNIHGTDKKRYTLFRCNNCEFIGIHPLPDQQYINNYYIENYKGMVKKNISDFNPLESNRAAIEDCYTKIKYIEKNSALNGKKLLDVGCGNGFFLYAAKKLNYKAIGVDIDQEAIDFGEKYLGVNIINNNINSFGNLKIKFQEYFDLVTFWMVLEHLREPFNTINDVKDLIKKGGYLAGSVPNANGIGVKISGLRKWYLTVPPEHLNYFNKKSLNELFIRAGLTPIFIDTVALYASPYIVFGIRSRIIKISKNSKYKIVKQSFMILHRLLTLSKRYLFYFPLNQLILLFRIEGNSLLFIVKK